MKILKNCFSCLIWLVELMVAFAHGFYKPWRESFGKTALFIMSQKMPLRSVA